MKLELSRTQFETQINALETRGIVTLEEAGWLISGIRTFLEQPAGAKPLVSNFAFKRLSGKVETIKLDSDILELSKVDGMVVINRPKPARRKIDAYA